MSKFKKGIVEDIRKQKAVAEEQRKLKKKYDIKEKDVVIVEKSNMVKFLVKTLSSVIRIIATILILTLAAIGLMVLFYPELREPFMEIIIEIFKQINMTIGGI